jgi:hypothetical protein
MSRWRRSFIVFLLLMAVSHPEAALACDFPFNPLPELFDLASDVFVGRVIASPWIRGADGSTTFKTAPAFNSRVPLVERVVRFSVEMRYKGADRREVTVAGMSDCFYPFIEGETYLVHGVMEQGLLQTGSPHRPMTLPEATEAMKYAEGRRENRPQALLYGDVRLFDNERKQEIRVAPGALVMRARRDGDGFASAVPIPATQRYEIVLPPGTYSLWLEQNGERLGRPYTLQLRAGEVRSLAVSP